MNNTSFLPEGPNITKNGLYEESVLFMLDLSGNGLFSGVFVPPPPRPTFLDGWVKSDDLATCDLCSWAWKRKKISKTESSFDIPDHVEWFFTLVIVSIVSAILGAIAMMIFFHCKRSKHINPNGTDCPAPRENIANISTRPPMASPLEKDKIQTLVSSSVPSESRVWCWLSKRPVGPTQLETITCSPMENHYTQMEEPYSNEDALYTELDMDGSTERDRNGEPYQNHGFRDQDIQACSAPSSAYYSDLSITPVPEQAYEVINLATVNVNWDTMGSNSKKSAPSRLTAIKEHASVPSDYV